MSRERAVSSPARQLAEDDTGASAVLITQRAPDSRRITPAGGPPAGPYRVILIATDGTAALLGAVVLAPLAQHPSLLAGFVLLVLVLLGSAGLYRLAHEQHMLDDCPPVVARVTAAWCVLTAVCVPLSLLQRISGQDLLLGCATQVVLTLLGRGLVHWRRRIALVRRPCTALLVGPEPAASRVASALQRHPASGIRVVGIVGDGAVPRRQDGATSALPLLTTVEDLRRAVIQNDVRRALLLGSAGAPQHRSWLRALAEMRCELWELDPDPSPYVPQLREPVRYLAGFRCRPLVGPRLPLRPGKRALDVVVSALLLVLAGPLLATCALWLRVSEGPGVVFRQERIGKDGRPFTLLKFRTHRPADPLESATRWSVAGDHHMPWFCRFLRRTSLDELLQLWNVFRGDMSLVGPRPERPYFVRQFTEAHPGYDERHRMPTGITGLAQINGLRGDTSIEDRCRYDNAYIADWSLWRDITILLRTAGEFFRPTGS
ncbi:exopolysaccharide biosynthesis polyprenyl glycosylphosphotransferase [Streptomyces sp. NPDC002795]|uniref:exopolysaccharide biosynthesis polyprenyl glycosylphosphotransferase n=1 Tax=Streptomyces sp. NPDC002795 TaxID=3364665 RepID=UPI0036868F65